MKSWMIAGLTLALTTALSSASLAQSDPSAAPSSAAPSADPHARGAKVRAACQADMQKLCADAGPGRAAFQCLRQHQDDVSADCKSAMASMGNGRHWGGQHGQGGQPAPAGTPAPN
jgi:hypothetical protein